MMRKQRRRVLVIGSPCGLAEAFDQLQGRDYKFEYLPDTQAAGNYLLRETADVVLLQLPSAETERRAALTWLHTARRQFPVVVLSGEPDIRPYLAAMESGAFDYLTSYTPLVEVERVLANAIRWRRHQAA